MKLSELKLNPNNPRIIKDDKFKKLVKSIQEFPEMMEKRPLVCVTDTVDGKIFPIGGNMRLKAMRELGMKEIPDAWVVIADEWTEEQRRQFIIKDNASFGEWDFEALTERWDVDDLKNWGVDVPIKWTAEEVVEDYFDTEQKNETDIISGDLFEIGEHRLLCGDSMNSDQVARLFNGKKADMVLTDPPYELDLDYTNILLFSENCHVFVFNNDRAIIRQLHSSPLDFKKFFVFYHSATAIPQEGGNEVFLDHVLVSHETYGKPKVRYNKGNGTRSVIKGEYRRASEHKHQKPFSFLQPVIEGYSNTGFIILDFFLGGGSTMIASHQLNRRCYGMELDPQYCDVVVRRMLAFDKSLKIKRNGVDETRKWLDKL